MIHRATGKSTPSTPTRTIPAHRGDDEDGLSNLSDEFRLVLRSHLVIVMRQDLSAVLHEK